MNDFTIAHPASDSTSAVMPPRTAHAPVPTLARGLAKRLYREVEDRIRRSGVRMNRLPHVPHAQSHHKIITRHVADSASDILVGASCNGKKGKQVVTRFIFLEPEASGFTAKALEVAARPELTRLYRTRILVTRHCIERVFQRLKITDIELALDIVRVVILGVIRQTQ
jgi:hypothetical protein